MIIFTPGSLCLLSIHSPHEKPVCGFRQHLHLWWVGRGHLCGCLNRFAGLVDLITN
jgi:hypothetical protein